MDGQCDELVTVVGHQFITLTVDIGGREAPRRAGLSAAAETCACSDHWYAAIKR